MKNKNNAPATLRIARKSQLSPEQLQHLEWRLSLPEHEFDWGPPAFWNSEERQDGLFVALLVGSGEPVGLAWSSADREAVDAAWWIDSKYRSKGYGSDLVERLAEMLASEGACGVADIKSNTFRGEYDLASQRLVVRLKLRLEG